MTKEEMVRRVFDEAWNAGDMKVFDELFDPAYVSHDVFMGNLDRERLKETIRGYRAAFPDLKMKIEEIHCDGDDVTVRFTGTGTHEGQLGGLAPTHKKVVVPGITLAKFRGDKVIEDHAMWASLKWLQDLGVVPPNEQLLRTRKQAEARPS